MTPPVFIERLDPADGALIQSKIEEYEAAIRDEPLENAYVILEDGKVYQITGGKESVYPEVLAKALKGAVLTHNHPRGSANEHSFSAEDLNFFRDFGLKQLRGVDEAYVYELDRSSESVDLPIPLFRIDLDGKDYRHNRVIDIAVANSLGYRRRKHEPGK